MATDKQVAIVTGAASGLGRAMALGLLTAGFDVAGVDRNTDGLASVAQTAQERQARGTLHAIGADLADPDFFDRIVANALGKFGRIDVLVNNAGIGQAAVRADQRHNPIRFWEATPEQWARFLTVNATAPIMMARAVLPRMLRAKVGAHHHRHHQPRHHGARGLPALRRQQGLGRGGDGGPVDRPRRHRRDGECAGAGRRHRHATGG